MGGWDRCSVQGHFPFVSVPVISSLRLWDLRLIRDHKNLYHIHLLTACVAGSERGVGGGGGEISILHLITQIQASAFWVCADADRDEKHRVQMVQTPFSFQHQQKKVWGRTFHSRTTTNNAVHLVAPPDWSYLKSICKEAAGWKPTTRPTFMN